MGEQQLEDESMSSDSPKFRKIINELLDYEHRDHDLRNTRFGKGLLFVICNVPFYLAAIIIGATTFGTCVMTENIPEGAPGTNPGQSMNLFLILYGSIALFFNLLVGLVLVALFHNMILLGILTGIQTIMVISFFAWGLYLWINVVGPNCDRSSSVWTMFAISTVVLGVNIGYILVHSVLWMFVEVLLLQ